MSRGYPEVPTALKLHEMALSRWDSEGGVGPDGPQEGGLPPHTVPGLTNTELVELRVRVIALENLVIALLAQASDQQLDAAREMATYISPRPGFTQHVLTVHAADHMLDLVKRAGRFQEGEPA